MKMNMRHAVDLLWTGLVLTFLWHAVVYWFRGTMLKQTFVQTDTTLLKSIASAAVCVTLLLAQFLWWQQR